MALIACTTGCLALYDQADGGVLAVPVEAWGEDGTPHVAGETQLVPAAEIPGFTRLEQAATALPKPVETRAPQKTGPTERPQPGLRPAPRGPRDPREGRV